MKWINEFSLADIISIVMLLATFITILLILIQRHDTNRPYITLRSKEQENFFIANNLESIAGKNDISVVCMGNGFAKEVSIKSRCFLGETKEQYTNLDLNGKWPRYKSKSGEALFNPNIQDIYFDAIMEKETFDLSPHFNAVLSVCCLAVLDLSVNHNNINDFNLDSYICCEIKYKDVIGKSFTRYIVITITPQTIHYNEEKVRFGLICKSVSRKTFNNIIENNKYCEI